MLKITFIWEGRKFWESISYTRLINWGITYITFSVSVDIQTFLGGEIKNKMTMFTQLALICVSVFFQFCTSFDQSNVNTLMKENSPFCGRLPKARVLEPLRYSRSGSETLRKMLILRDVFFKYVVYNLFMKKSMCTHVCAYLCGCGG